MKRLYIDFDGVILDTINPSYEALRKLNIEHDYEEKEKYYININWKELIEISEELNNSIESIIKIIDSNIYNVSILTHVNSVDEIVAKTEYIRKHIKDIPIISVPKIISKTKIVNPEGAILIDDYIQNLIEWEAEGGIAVCFSPGLNSNGFRVIDKLEQILTLFD